MHPSSRTDVRAEAGGEALRLEGRDALSVLHRISTASLEDLAPGAARATLFCDFRGRLLHRAAVAHGRDGAVWLVRGDAAAGTLASHVERHVFREDLRVSGPSGVARVAVRYGSPATAGTFDEEAAPRRRVTLISGEVLEWGGGPDGEPLDDRARILAGLPRHGFEIRDAFTPFEVGLAREVDLAKGCYTGQEALLRLVTYGSVRRQLVGVAGPGPPPAPGARLVRDGTPAGEVTSAAADGGGGFVALAVARREELGRPAGIALEGLAAPIRVRVIPAGRALGLP